MGLPTLLFLGIVDLFGGTVEIDRIIKRIEELLGERCEFQRTFTAGQHAATLLVSTSDRSLVVKTYPKGDDSAQREARVLEHASALGKIVPQVIVWTDDPQPLIVTSLIPGTLADTSQLLVQVGRELGKHLAMIHSLSVDGIELFSNASVAGTLPIQNRARKEWEQKFAPENEWSDSGLGRCDELVFSHGDFWLGNTVWIGGDLSGIVDWSGATIAPRGMDIAWARQDLMLLGSTEAADALVSEYFATSLVPIEEIAWWDRQMAARAVANVETWAPNYAGMRRSDLTAPVLRRKMDQWIARLGVYPE